jgi:peroxiredoxin
MDDALVLIRFGLAVVFSVAGIGKLLDRPGSRDALTDFDVPRGFIGPMVVLLPAAELATAVLLLFATTARWGGAAAVALLSLFVFGLFRVLRRGEAPDCHCFGQVHSEPASWSTVARNAALAIPAAFVLGGGPGPQLVNWADSHSAQALWLIATSSLAAVSTISCVLLWRQNRRLRVVGPALPTVAPRIGNRAPRFTLPTTGGQMVGLHELLADERACVLTFVARGCGPCAALLPEIARWTDALSDRLAFAVVSIGDANSAQELVGDYGLTQVLVDAEGKVGRDYGMVGTPSAVLLAPDGRVRSAPAGGAVAIEALVRVALQSDDEHPFVVHQAA